MFRAIITTISLLLLTACASQGGQREQREYVGRLRHRIEPIVESFVSERVERDCDTSSAGFKEENCIAAQKLAERFGEIQGYADDIGAAWDLWLAEPDASKRDELIVKLHFGVELAGSLVPYITDDSDKSLLIRTGLEVLQAVIEEIAIRIEATDEIGEMEQLQVRCGLGASFKEQSAMFGAEGASVVLSV